MSNQTLNLTDTVYKYLLNVSLRESEIMADLRRETATRSDANMQISPEQGQFMAMLVKLIGAKRTLEVGVFTGYSALAVAHALPDDGEIIACDVSEEFTAIARRYWATAGVADKIDLRLAPALETLEQLISDRQENSFDFAFIDADKTNYDGYYEYALRLLRTGGLIAIDNVLWDGKIVDPSITDDDTEAIRRLNRKLHGDDRVDISMVPIADGLTLARKR